jgi:AraC-like DNA-binding protein
MLDPLFPVRLESLTLNDAQTVMTGDGYVIAFLAEGRLTYKYIGERGVLEAGRLLLAGEGTTSTLALQRGTVVKVLRFGRAIYNRLAVQFYESGFLDGFFPEAAEGKTALPVIVDPGRGLAEVRTLFDKLEREFADKPSRYELMIQSLLTELFILLDRTRGRETTTAPVIPTNINALIRYIQEHYTDEFSLEELASRLGLTPAYFSRLFHEKTGKPLFEFINSIRIQKACQLLKRTGMPIIEIAYAVGYNNLSFFNRYFRRLMRMSPREYRNL